MAPDTAQHRVGLAVRGAQRDPDQVEVGRRRTAARLSASWPVANIPVV